MATNPNLPSTTHNLPPGHIDGLPEALQIYEIESFRDKQAVELTDAMHREEIRQGRMLTDDEKDQIRSLEYIKYDLEAEAYLQAHGIDVTHPDFNTYMDKIKGLSIDKIAPSDWNVSPIDPNDSSNLLPSPRDNAMNDLATNFASPVAPPASPTVPPVPTVPPMPTIPPMPTSPPTNPAQTSLDEAKRELAAVTAKRQVGLGWNFIGRKDKQAEFDQSQREYKEKLMDLVRDDLQREIAAGNYADEADQRLYVAARLMNSYKELQEATNEAMGNSKMVKFVQFMTRGGTVTRIIKGVGLGVGVGVAGLAVTAASGGAALGVGAATGMAAAGRLARGYAAFDAKAGHGANVIETHDAAKQKELRDLGVENASTDEVIDKLSVALMGRLGNETKTEISKRRKSFGKAALLVAGGATAVELLRLGYDVVSDYVGGSPSTGTAQPQGSSHEGSGSGAGQTPTEKPTGEEGSGGDRGTEKPGGEEPGGEGRTPTPGEEPGGAGTEKPAAAEYGSDALTISNGEGFYQTFQEMDIPQKDWAGLLEKVGPELHDMQVDGNPLAYKMPNGEWGIRMTPDGKMPQGALDAITNAHNEMTGQGGSAGSGAEASPGASTAEGVSSNAGETPAAGESLRGISDLVRQTDITAADIEGNSTMETLTHVSPNFAPEGLGQRLNLPASEWARLQEYIVSETSGGNKLYTDVFAVNDNGYLRFTGNRIPAGTMADMLMNISPSVRYDLAA